MGFVLSGVQVLHKRGSGTKEEKASTPKKPHDLYISIRNKPGSDKDDKGQPKKPIVIRSFVFQSDFVLREAFDRKFTSAADGDYVKPEDQRETFAMSFITTDAGVVYPVKVREDFEEVHAFEVKDGGKKQKSNKVTLTSFAEMLQTMGLIKNESGEQAYFNLKPVLNEDGTVFSQGEYLTVYELEKVDMGKDAEVIDKQVESKSVEAAKPAKKAEKVTVAEAVVTEEDEVVVEDEPVDEDSDEDSDDAFVE